MGNYGYLGIDISKGYADFLVVRSDKQSVESSFRLYDVPEGHQQLGKLIDKWLAREKFDILFCGVESTGGYENNWVTYLQGLSASKPIKVTRLNAKGVKSLSDAALKRTITDSVSAENIAMYLIDFSHKIRWLDPFSSAKVYSDGRRHNSFIRMLKKQRIQLSNQLEKLLYQECSPLLCYCRHGIPGWLLLLLEKYPTMAAMSKAGISKMIKIKGVTEDKAIALIKKIEATPSPTSSHIGAVIKSTAKQILLVEASIKTEKGSLIKRFKEAQEVHLLTSISGLGEQSAIEILIEIEDINRFEDAKKLSAYFGLHPVFKQSGDGKWGNHMSKKGRSEIRAVLYMSGMTAIRYSDLFKRVYANARAKGKNHFSAMGVVMHKLLRVVFGVLKHRVPFNADKDVENQDKAKEKQQEKEAEKKQSKKEQSVKLERYNDVELAISPVSKRHAKRRKKEAAP
jgi:transposase